MKKVRIGTGAGCGNDRIEPAVDLVEKGELDYIVFECLSERTISIAQMDKIENPDKGYNEMLEYRMNHILKLAKENNTTIITNMGAANPIMAAKIIEKIAVDQNIRGLKIAVIEGDDILDDISNYEDTKILESGERLKNILNEVVSANVYLGIEPIVEALKANPDIIIMGRVADPSLFLAPLVYEFNWNPEDYNLIGKGTLVGHMLECAGQVTGGYFADPGYKDVENLWNLGFPIAEVSEDGNFILTKLKDSGGIIDKRTCAEQLLYEIQDPSNYITPDCIANFMEVEIHELKKDIVSLKGAKGYKKPKCLKASIGYQEYYIGEGQISYGGTGAIDRAKFAAEVIKKRLDNTNTYYEEITFDIIGQNSLYKDSISNLFKTIPESSRDVRLRVAARTKDKLSAFKVGNEVESMYTNGPYGGGGATKKIESIVSLASILIPREQIKPTITIREV